jgi:hypothetical protein
MIYLIFELISKLLFFALAVRLSSRPQQIYTCKMTKQSKPPLSFADDLCQEGERRGGAPRFRGEGPHNAEVSGKSHRQPAWFKQFGSKVFVEFR